MITILFIGDVVGKPGRRALKELVPRICESERPDMIIANVENAAGGSGVTPEIVNEFLISGIHALTTGDHIWRNKAVFDIIGRERRLLRAANFVKETPGWGSIVVECAGGISVGVINLLGRVFMPPVECPFHAVDSELETLSPLTSVIVVDFHAEATSEKIAMGRYLDGKVAAVVGSHTHVQTADEQIFPGGTAYISDLGMTGPSESILGREIKPVVSHFVTRIPQRFNVAKGVVELQGALVTVDERTGKATAIKRVKERLEA